MSELTRGIYSETITQNIGTGGTSRKQEIKNYYKAESGPDDTVSIQLMDNDGNMLPIRDKVPVVDFEKRFRFEPEFKPQIQVEKERKVEKAIAQAEIHYRRNELHSAEFEYGKALKLDEENVRANFGIGMVYLKTGEDEKARATFEKLAHIDAVFENKNKHIFNDLGIELRRLGLYDQARDYYEKALTIAPDDENLFFNLARALFEKGDLEGSGKVLEKGLALNPTFPEGLRLKQALAAARGN